MDEDVWTEYETTPKQVCRCLTGDDDVDHDHDVEQIYCKKEASWNILQVQRLGNKFP